MALQWCPQTETQETLFKYKKHFKVRLAKPWNRSRREVVEPSSFLDTVLCSLLYFILLSVG